MDYHAFRIVGPDFAPSDNDGLPQTSKISFCGRKEFQVPVSIEVRQVCGDDFRSYSYYVSLGSHLLWMAGGYLSEAEAASKAVESIHQHLSKPGFEA
jgi:hypothetical protein